MNSVGFVWVSKSILSNVKDVAVYKVTGPWFEHGTAWYSCNRYDESSGVEARDAQSRSRASLERYLHVRIRLSNKILVLTSLHSTIIVGLTMSNLPGSP